MAIFDINLIGSHERLAIDLPFSSLADLADAMGQTRYLAGDLVEESGELVRVLIPTARVQIVAELCGQAS